jgi:hypothetical protein
MSYSLARSPLRLPGSADIIKYPMLRFLESISFSTFQYKRHGRTISLSQPTEAWKIITVACIPPVVLLLAGLGGNSRLSRKNFLAAFDWSTVERKIVGGSGT